MAMMIKPKLDSDALYDDAPRIVIWEMTRACALACTHCRAEAIPYRDPAELTTAEAFQLVDNVLACNNPIFVLTGGDPLMRDDIFKIAEYATSRGVSVSVSPSATGRLTRDAIRRLAVAGVRRISLSLDAADSDAHDAFRGLKGSYRRTLEAAVHARDYGVAVQINTSVGQHNAHNLTDFESVLAPLDISLWSLFFILPVGRADTGMCLDARETEEAFSVINKIARRASFAIKTTEAPHYRRYAMQHAIVPPRERSEESPAPPRFANIGDGRGFVFISHHGEVQPSGFLPLTAGNIRERSLLDIYRNDAMMRRLRRPDTFEGKCGVCEFRRVCGGSRARAYAATGDPFASDPSCSYIPAFYNGVKTTV
jgi:radical SAM protein